MLVRVGHWSRYSRCGEEAAEDSGADAWVWCPRRDVPGQVGLLSNLTEESNRRQFYDVVYLVRSPDGTVLGGIQAFPDTAALRPDHCVGVQRKWWLRCIRRTGGPLRWCRNRSTELGLLAICIQGCRSIPSPLLPELHFPLVSAFGSQTHIRWASSSTCQWQLARSSARSCWPMWIGERFGFQIENVDLA